MILTQSWQWWRCWQCSWRWTPRSRSWAPTWLSPPPGPSMYRRRGLKNNVQTFLDEILVWEFFNHLGDAETPQRWCNWLSATTKSLTIIFWSKILIVETHNYHLINNCSLGPPWPEFQNLHTMVSHLACQSLDNIDVCINKSPEVIDSVYNSILKIYFMESVTKIWIAEPHLSNAWVGLLNKMHKFPLLDF